MAEETSATAGSIKIEKCNLMSAKSDQEINLLPIVQEFSIYESLSYPFMTMNMIVIDALALTSVMPIIGEETIDIEFSVPDKSFQKNVAVQFRIVAIKDLRADSKSRQAQYLIRGISAEAIYDWTKHVRKSYADMPTSQMAKKIFDDFLKIDKDLKVTESKGNRTIVIPNMRPTEAINFMCRESRHQEFEPSNYVFYQNVDGYFFKTIEEMIDDSSGEYRVEKYYTTEKNVGKKINLPTENTNNKPRVVGANRGNFTKYLNQGKKPSEWYKLNWFKFQQLFDMEKTIKMGGLDNKVFVLNPVTNLYEQKTYKYLDDEDKFKRTRSGKGKGRVIFQDSELGKLDGDSRHQFIITNKGMETEPNVDEKSEFLHYLTASSTMLQHIVVDINIPGDTEKRIGQKIDLEFPEWGATDNVFGEVNKFLSGTYLIVDLRHIYSSTGGYSCTMTCVKNCFNQDPEESKYYQDNRKEAAKREISE